VLADLLSKNFHHQIGKAIHDARLVSKTFGRIDHAKDFDNTFHAIKAAKRGLYFG
jgi:hypothetical protein